MLIGQIASWTKHIILLLERNFWGACRAAARLPCPLLFCACFASALASGACSADSNAAAPAPEKDAGADAEEPVRSLPGFSKTSTGWAFTTTEVKLEASEERYVCYVAEAPEDMVIGAIRSGKNSAVHHFLLVQALSKEPDGMRDCNVIFQLTWAPLYAATRADSELKMPPGAARTIKKGSQVLLQVHMLNASTAPLKRAVSVSLDTTTEVNPKEVGLTLFGSTLIHVPPNSSVSVENTCKTEQDLHLYALFPHMHVAGRKLELEIGKPDGSFEQIYERNPFSFDNQYMDAFDETIPAGTPIRVRCSYDNQSSSAVDFGESASDEMCFAIGFTVDGLPFQFCSEKTPPLDLRVPRDPFSGICGLTSNDIGKVCTRTGDECNSKLFCSASLLNMDLGVCFRLGCDANNPCGTGNTCCTFPAIGNMANVCIPEACRPDFCIPIDHPY